jgi:hypothetical protein
LSALQSIRAEKAQTDGIPQLLLAWTTPGSNGAKHHRQVDNFVKITLVLAVTGKTKQEAADIPIIN